MGFRTPFPNIAELAPRAREQIRRNFAELEKLVGGGAVPMTYAAVRRTTNFAVPALGGEKALVFDAVVEDPSGLWSSAAPSGMTTNAAGLWHIAATARWLQNGDTGRALALYVGGALKSASVVAHGTVVNEAEQETAAIVRIGSGVFVEVKVSTAGEGTVRAFAGYSPRFTMTRLSA